MRTATCRCGAVWHDNHGAAHCAACHRTWTSMRAFDAHRVDNGCADPATSARRDGRRMFAARADATGALVWEHAAGAQKARDRFSRASASDGKGTCAP